MTEQQVDYITMKLVKSRARLRAEVARARELLLDMGSSMEEAGKRIRERVETGLNDHLVDSALSREAMRGMDFSRITSLFEEYDDLKEQLADAERRVAGLTDTL